MKKGLFYAIAAYALWGLLPLFWKALGHVPAYEILAHRVIWALVVVFLILLYQGNWSWLKQIFQHQRTWLTFIFTSLLISLNWFVFIWAVNEGYIVETSLGYFINPLLNVLLGVFVLKERVRFWQGIALLVAFSGVLYLTIGYGEIPWIALTLAGSFGMYGLLRKTASLNSLEGLTTETVLLFPVALLYLLYLEWNGSGAFGNSDTITMLLLPLAGIATAVPLLLFAAGARRITLTFLGVLQYIAPTLQLLLGVFVYNEALTEARLIGFCIIWLALFLYTAEGIVHSTRAARLSNAVGRS